MKYRAEIDGFRAVAVIPVILFHAGFETFEGGFIGVDVFFVISGYLITSIIHEEIQQGSFSIVRFYERRVRRILPALFTVSLACIPFAWLWMMPGQFKNFSQSLVAVNVFSSNILFWRESGYFAPAAELKPLLHTWSLAVEEQFYIFFPLLLLLFWRASGQILIVILLVLSALSLGLAEWASTTHRAAGFYLLPTRAWELGIGAILALSAPSWRDLNGKVAQAASIAGLAMVAYAVFQFNEDMPFPSIWTLLPVLGAGLVIAFAQSSNVIGSLLGLRLIVGIGLISYSLYLWHVPLFVFARIRLIGGVSDLDYLVLSGLALLLAYVSWRFIEKPFRNKSKLTRAQVFKSASVVSSTIITFGIVGYLLDGIPTRVPPAVFKMQAWAQDRDPHWGECEANARRFIEPERSCVYGTEKDPTVGIMGDSHAMSLARGLGDALSKHNYGLRVLTYMSCAPVVGYHMSDNIDECPQYNFSVQHFLASNHKPEIVTLISRWTLYIEGTRFNNGEGGVESGKSAYALPIGKGHEFIADPDRIRQVGHLFRASIQRLLQSGKRVVLVYPVPEVGWNVPNYLARELAFGIPRQEPLSTSFEVFKRRSEHARNQLDMLADNPNLLRIRPEEIFCDTFVPGRCVAELEGKPLYFDDDHLNNIGASMLADKIVTAMERRGWLNAPNDSYGRRR